MIKVICCLYESRSLIMSEENNEKKLPSVDVNEGNEDNRVLVYHDSDKISKINND